MRLPFLQMESDLLAHGAPQVASLAGCLPVQALGHIAFLRAWAVAQATDESPPDGWARGEDAAAAIEAAAQWAGEPGRLLRALKVAKLVEVTPEGVRVLGLEPYVVAWNKNAKAKERMANARARSANVRGTSGEQASVEHERSAKFGRQMQTQMEDVEAEEKKLPASQVAAGAAPVASGEEADTSERPPLVLTQPEKPARKPREPSAAERLYAGLEDARRERCERERVEFISEGWHAARINARLGPLAKATGDEADRLNDAFAEFLEDQRGVECDPPWSLGFFLACRSRYESKAARAAGGAA